MGLRIVDTLVSLLMIPIAGAILLGISSFFLSPSVFILPSFFALALPYLLLFHAFITLYWLVRWSKKFWYALLILLLAGWEMPALWAFNGPGEGEASARVITYNVHASYGPSEDLTTQFATQRKLLEREPHLLCFQEFSSALATPTLSREFPNYVHRGQLSVYSKWPIISSDYHKFSKAYNYGGNAYLWVDVESPKGTVRIFNFHLASIQLGSSEYLFPSSWIHLSSTDSLELRGRSYFPLLAKGFRFRAQQQKELLSAIQESPYPVLLCGDLNDVPGSHSYWQFAQVYPDAFRQAGWGSGRTFHSPLFPLRIDYVFNGTPWLPLRAEVLNLEGSDHDPLLVHFALGDAIEN